MHVALVCPYSLDTPGGVGTHVLGLSAWLVAQGHDAMVIAPGGEGHRGADGVSLHLVGRSHNFRFNGSVAQLAVGRRQGTDALRVAREADVVHVHEPLTPGIAFAVARATRNLVVTHHASFTVGPLVSGLLRRRAAAVRPAAAIAVSEAALQTARSLTGTTPDVIGNGVFLPDAPPHLESWRGGVRPRIGFLGRLDEPRKGFAVFRDVARRARKTGLDAEFVALGPGKVDPGPVRLLGAVDNTERNHALQQVDVLLAPNLFGESFGLILVEALAAGCAVVASDLPGFRAVLAQAGTGTMFPAGNVDAGFAMLRGALSNPEDPVLLHGSAHSWSWDVLGPRVLAVYQTAIGG